MKEPGDSPRGRTVKGMSVTERPLISFADAGFRDLRGLYEPWQAAPVMRPSLLALNQSLAHELGLDPDALRTPEGRALLVGNELPASATPVAQAYAGHQFGGYSPRLGDGRALLLGELRDGHGRWRDLHLKGSGRTPFSRGGDGKAAVGPMLREFIIGEAMHALGIPTTRALAVVATGEAVRRETMLPGAVLCRVAASHLRVGTFQYAASHEDKSLLQRLADYAIDRHHPHVRGDTNSGPSDEISYVAFLASVLDAQAALVARWMHVGFIHGVMNTDNVTISGETIDYGPCAFMDAYDPATVFSSIDHDGRYAYGNQPQITQWNLARLAEALLPLLAPTTDEAVPIAMGVLNTFPARFHEHWSDGMRAKLGLTRPDDGDSELFADLLAIFHTGKIDYTSGFRSLSAVLRGEEDRVHQQFRTTGRLDPWLSEWRSRLASEGLDQLGVAASMDAVNPVYVPRNHLVEDALASATGGDLDPFERLLDVIRHPFDERPGLEPYAMPAAGGNGTYRTFCGT